MLSQIFAQSTLDTSRELSDAKFKALNDKYKYFTPDDEAAKQLYKDCYKAALAINPADRSALSAANAYTIMVFFGAGNIKDTLAGFDIVADQQEDLSGFCKAIQLPICIDYGRTSFNLDIWKARLPLLGTDVLKFGNHLSRIEEMADVAPCSSVEFQEILPRALFARYDENPELAKLVMIYEPKEVFFNGMLESMKRAHVNQSEVLPDIAVNVKLSGGEDTYFVKLPEADLRYQIFTMKDDSMFYTAPAKHGFYVLIVPEEGFDPENIDWVNLEKQGHKIVHVYHALVGPENDLRIDVCPINARCDFAGHAFRKDILDSVCPKIVESMPEIGVISDSDWFSRSRFSFGDKSVEKPYFTNGGIFYISEELSELKEAMLRSVGFNTYSVIKVDQAKKLLELENGCLHDVWQASDHHRPLDYRSAYVSQFVVGDCENVEQIRTRHAALEALRESNVIKFHLLLWAANNISASSAVRYGDLCNLSEEILDFLSSYVTQQAYKRLIKINELLQDAHNVIDIKRNILKIYVEKILMEEAFLEKIDDLPEDKLDILISQHAATIYHMGFVKLLDIYELDSKILETVLSGNALILYVDGKVSLADLLHDECGVLGMKQHILGENILMVAKVSNVPMLEFGPIDKLSEQQVDFLMTKRSNNLMTSNVDAYLQLILDIYKHGDDSHYMEARRLELNIIAESGQQVAEGFLVNLDQHKFDFISSKYGLLRMMRSGYADVEQLVTLEDEKLEELDVYSYLFTEYFKKGGTFADLVAQEAGNVSSFVHHFQIDDDERSISGDFSEIDSE